MGDAKLIESGYILTTSASQSRVRMVGLHPY